MKILKNNYNQETNAIKNDVQIELYPRKLVCGKCKSELEYEKEDMRIGEYGYMFLDCPLCGHDNSLEDNEYNITLTAKNIEFPTHFHHVCKENRAVDCCNNNEVKNAIYEAINYFRKNKDEYTWYTWKGNLLVYVNNFSGDGVYEIYVSNDFYNVEIPFEKHLDY